jgi:hypothetical protein
LRPPSWRSRDPAFEIGDRRGHLRVGGVGHAPAGHLDGAHAAVARGKQSVALRGQIF